MLKSGLQVDVRILEKESYGAALLYFTGSKGHNVALRGRANKMGYTLNEYALATLKGERPVARATEEEIYAKLGLDYIPPELRENTGEIEAAAEHRLPDLIELKDIRGDLQMHTTASDGKNSIEEMALAAKDLGYEYISLTDHSKAVTVANGLDEKRTLEQIKKIHAANAKHLGIRIFASSEVDVLKNGKLDLDDEVLAQLDIVLVSIHSYMNLERAEMTERILAAIENPYTQIIGHPTGRLVLHRDAYAYDMERVLDAAKKHGVVMECNASPERLDLKDTHLRMAKERGVKIVISTDAHSTRGLAAMRYGVLTARRGWLEAKDVINTRSTEKLLASLRPKPGAASRGKHAATAAAARGERPSGPDQSKISSRLRIANPHIFAHDIESARRGLPISLRMSGTPATGAGCTWSPREVSSLLHQNSGRQEKHECVSPQGLLCQRENLGCSPWEWGPWRRRSWLAWTWCAARNPFRWDR